MGKRKYNIQQVTCWVSTSLILFLLYALITSYSKRNNVNSSNPGLENPALLLRYTVVRQPEKNYSRFSNFGGFGPGWIQ